MGRLATTRYTYQGLAHGRDDQLMDKAVKAQPSTIVNNKMKLLMADGMCTPWQAHHLSGAKGGCPLCHAVIGDIEHCLYDAPVSYSRETRTAPTYRKCGYTPAEDRGVTGIQETRRQAW